MEAPFKIGQKVIRITSGNQYYPKGEIITVLSIWKCKCGRWKLTGKPCDSGDDWECDCGEVISEKGIPAECKYFAPLPEQRERINYVAVSETLRETAVETFITQTN